MEARVNPAAPLGAADFVFATQTCLMGHVLQTIRIADAISIDGAFVSPEQIEQAFFGFPGILDVATVGMKQAHGHDQIWLAVVTNGALDKQALAQFLVEKNARWSVVKISVVPKFKRNEMGEIVPSRVREILLAQQTNLSL